MPLNPGQQIYYSPTEKDIIRYLNHSYIFDSNGVLEGVDAIWKPIPENNTQPTIVPRGSIAHTNGATYYTPWYSLWKFWNRSDITKEAHFQLDLDGTIIQAMSVHRRADCNYKANMFYLNSIPYGFISYEAADKGAATLDKTGYTLPQLHDMVCINTALVLQYGVHCTMPATWTSSGIGHHCLHDEWSQHNGPCPGKARIAQMDYIRRDVTERVAHILQGMGKSCQPQTT